MDQQHFQGVKEGYLHALLQFKMELIEMGRFGLRQRGITYIYSCFEISNITFNTGCTAV